MSDAWDVSVGDILLRGRYKSTSNYTADGQPFTNVLLQVLPTEAGLGGTGFSGTSPRELLENSWNLRYIVI